MGKGAGRCRGGYCVGSEGANGDSEVTNRDGGGVEENVGIRLGGRGKRKGREEGEDLGWAFMFKISLYLCEVHMATDIPITNYLPNE